MLLLQLFAAVVLLIVAHRLVRWTVEHFGEHDWRDGLAVLLLGLALTTAAGVWALIAMGRSELTN